MRACKKISILTNSAVVLWDDCPVDLKGAAPYNNDIVNAKKAPIPLFIVVHSAGRQSQHSHLRLMNSSSTALFTYGHLAPRRQRLAYTFHHRRCTHNKHDHHNGSRSTSAVRYDARFGRHHVKTRNVLSVFRPKFSTIHTHTRILPL